VPQRLVHCGHQDLVAVVLAIATLDAHVTIGVNSFSYIGLAKQLAIKFDYHSAMVVTVSCNRNILSTVPRMNVENSPLNEVAYHELIGSVLDLCVWILVLRLIFCLETMHIHLVWHFLWCRWWICLSATCLLTCGRWTRWFWFGDVGITAN